MNIMEDLRALKKSGLSESEIARRSGVPQSTVWRILNDKRSKPNLRTIEKILPLLYPDKFHPTLPSPSPAQDGAA